MTELHKITLAWDTTRPFHSWTLQTGSTNGLKSKSYVKVENKTSAATYAAETCRFCLQKLTRAFRHTTYPKVALPHPTHYLHSHCQTQPMLPQHTPETRHTDTRDNNSVVLLCSVQFVQPPSKLFQVQDQKGSSTHGTHAHTLLPATQPSHFQTLGGCVVRFSVQQETSLQGQCLEVVPEYI